MCVCLTILKVKGSFRNEKFNHVIKTGPSQILNALKKIVPIIDRFPRKLNCLFRDFL